MFPTSLLALPFFPISFKTVHHDPEDHSEPGLILTDCFLAASLDFMDNAQVFLSPLALLKEPYQGGTGDAEPVTGASLSLLIAGISEHTWLADSQGRTSHPQARRQEKSQIIIQTIIIMREASR